MILACSSITVQAQTGYSPIAGISTEQPIKVYPNPATDMVTITANLKKVGHITINNIIGKQLKKVKGSLDGRYDVSDLRRGVYIIRIFDKNDELVKALRLSKV